MFLILSLTQCFPSSGTINIENIQNITTPPISCFTPAPSNPQLTKDSLFSGSDWNDPSVIKDGGQFVMYASSDLNLDIAVKIYRLISADGISWTLNPNAAVLSGGPQPSDWDHKSVETPSVVLFNGTYHLFYTGYPESYDKVTDYKIGHATSADGINWVKELSPLVSPIDINATIIGEPGAVVFNNKIYLYFTAIVNDQQHIALQTYDGSTWTPPEVVLTPDPVIYPRSQWMGYSTPQPVVFNNSIHLFFDVATANPWNQDKIHRAISIDGKTQWALDAFELFDRHNFTWTYKQIRAPAPLYDNNQMYLWFAGEVQNPTRLGVGFATCSQYQ